VNSPQATAMTLALTQIHMYVWGNICSLWDLEYLWM